MREKEVTIPTVIPLQGVFRYPDSDPPYPAVLLCHGTIEQDRDGNLLSYPDGRKLPHRNFFRRISESLTRAGIATLSWDKRGYGASLGPRGEYYTDADDAAFAYDVLAKNPLIINERIFIYGQSAGVHTACLLARFGIHPFGYILSGGLSSDYLSMLAYNYLRPVRYARQGPRERSFVMKHDAWGYTLGHSFPCLIDAVHNKMCSITLPFRGENRIWEIDHRLFSGDLAPENLFHYINAPSLVIHGECDMNVPLGDAYRIRGSFERMNLAHRFITIPEGDHSFQKVASNKNVRIEERISLNCFKNPYIPEYFECLTRFCQEIIHAKYN